MPAPRFIAVLLAAGRGTRAGGDKLGQEKDGRPLIAHALAPVVESGVFTHVAGVCSRGSQIFERVSDAVQSVLETAPDAAFSTSVSAALRHAEAVGADGAALVLADMPLVRADTYRALGAAWTPGAVGILPTCNGRDGNPLLAGRPAFALADRLSGDRGLKPLIIDDPSLVRLPVNDGGVLLDIDTPEDLARWRAGTLSD
jgi:molybdenum cofactor cytidylyltransferase